MYSRITSKDRERKKENTGNVVVESYAVSCASASIQVLTHLPLHPHPYRWVVHFYFSEPFGMTSTLFLYDRRRVTHVVCLVIDA